MISARTLTRRLLASTFVMLVAASGTVGAADDPEAAVQALLEAVSTTELSDLDGLVCPHLQEAVRDAFSDAALGIDVMAESFETMAVSVQRTAVELLDVDDSSARVRVTGTIVIDVDADELRALTRELLETGAGPDDPPVSAEDVEQMLPFMGEALALEQTLDAEISLVREEGEWVVCGGLGPDAWAGTDANLAASVEAADLCTLATPAELSQLSSLDYDSSAAFEEFCTYSQSDPDQFHAATVGLILDTDLEGWREVFPPDSDFEVAGAPAFSSGSDIFTEAGDSVLQVSVWLPENPPTDVDVLTLATRISELFLPRLGGLAVGQPGLASGPSLCDGMSLLDLNSTSGRAFDEVVGDAWFCSWSSSDAVAGLDTVVATVSDLTLGDFRELFDETADGAIAGQPALTTSEQAVVELPDGRTLAVSVSFDESVAPGLPADELALAVAESLLTEVPPEPEATATPSAGEGLLGGDGEVDDLCRAVPFEQLADISGVPFEDPGFGPGFCEYYGGNPDSGWHYALTSLEHRPMSLWLEDYPEGVSIEIHGQPAVLVEGALPDLDMSALVISLVPGFDDLTFAAGIGIDTSTGTEVEVASVAVALAELGLEALAGSGG